MAGFAVGAVERALLLPTSDIGPGDVLLGLSSSGLHSNGFSLVRKVVARAGLTYASPCPWDSTKTLGHALLEPTRIYAKALVPLLRRGGLLKALAHITGGGFIDNVPRVLPPGTGAVLDAGTYPLLDVFKWVMRTGNVAPLEMARTFNNGVGMVLVVAPSNVDEVIKALKEQGEHAISLGQITDQPGVKMKNLESWLG